MRQNQTNKRMRGRSRKGVNPLTRSYESNGPDVKVRGTAQHVAEKYVTLARDAQASGDRIASESYWQHAEHYFRIIAAAQSQQSFHAGRSEGVTRATDDDERRLGETAQETSEGEAISADEAGSPDNGVNSLSSDDINEDDNGTSYEAANPATIEEVRSKNAPAPRQRRTRTPNKTSNEEQGGGSFAEEGLAAVLPSAKKRTRRTRVSTTADKSDSKDVVEPPNNPSSVSE